MTGINMKTQKIRLSISKEDFVSKLNFNTNDEKKRCHKYLELKGISYHVVLANYIGLDASGKIDYEKVQNLYIYDKRIRNILYKYMSALEEGIRGFICNRYSKNSDKIKKLSKVIFKSIQDGNSLAKELENLDFNNLINVSMNLDKEDLSELYNNNPQLEVNLRAVRILRNVVSHHRMLFVYEDYGDCYVEDTDSNSLIDNIKNLKSLLNPYYQEFLVNKINNAPYDDDPKFEDSLPISAIIKL